MLFFKTSQLFLFLGISCDTTTDRNEISLNLGKSNLGDLVVLSGFRDRTNLKERRRCCPDLSDLGGANKCLTQQTQEKIPAFHSSSIRVRFFFIDCVGRPRVSVKNSNRADGFTTFIHFFLFTAMVTFLDPLASPEL